MEENVLLFSVYHNMKSQGPSLRLCKHLPFIQNVPFNHLHRSTPLE